MKIEYYLINLDDNKDRLLSSTKQLQKFNISATRIPAFDGRKLNLETYPPYNAPRALKYMGRQLVGGEIGCYMSHIRCAEAFLASDAEFAVILEDDFKIEINLPEIISKALYWLQNKKDVEWHLINIGNEKIKLSTQLHNFKSENQSYSLRRAFYFPMTTTGLIWNRKGAKEFLEQPLDLFAPVDNFFRYWLTNSGKGLAFAPQLVSTTGDESTIDGSSVNKKRKNINRAPLYGLVKQRRLIKEKITALKHLALSKLKNW
jgi:glycosyl transferase family 25